MRKYSNLYGIVVIILTIIIAGCAKPGPKKLCNGNFKNRVCTQYHNHNKCMAALKRCQNAKGQVKPWLCGECR